MTIQDLLDSVHMLSKKFNNLKNLKETQKENVFNCFLAFFRNKIVNFLLMSMLTKIILVVAIRKSDQLFFRVKADMANSTQVILLSYILLSYQSIENI